MACVLNIDTSGSNGLVALAVDGECIKVLYNNNATQHASFLQPAIQQILVASGYSKNNVDAIAVSNGPGSYTGLRVGLASAKGLCFAWDKPLITINSLKVLAYSVWQKIAGDVDGILPGTLTNNDINKGSAESYNINFEHVGFCPMIDARRMEVFFAVYDHAMDTIIPAAAAVLDEHFLKINLDKGPILFTGNGMQKWKTIVQHPNAFFITQSLPEKALCQLSYLAFGQSDFDNLAYAEPFYIKEFYTTHPAHHNS